MSSPIRLLLVDNATVHRRALAALLKRRPGLQVVAEAQTASDALAQVQALRPDMVIVEPELPEGGPELIAALCRAEPSCTVLVLTAKLDATLARAGVNAGARGYLLKACEPDELVQAIQRVQAGELVVAPAVAASVLKEPGDRIPEAPGPGSMTERQLEVLRLVAQGLTNSQIARELYVSEHTVKGHLVKMMSKLGLENRVQLAAHAIQHGLATPPSDETQAAPPENSPSPGRAARSRPPGEQDGDPDTLENRTPERSPQSSARR